MTRPTATAYRARWILPGDRRPLENGVLVVSQGQILQVAERWSGPEVDLGDVALIPGLVNCHTHLEFSGLDKPLAPLAPFTDWIRAVIAARRAPVTPTGAAIRRGLAESLAGGVTLLADIATTGWQPSDYLAESPVPQAIVLQELLGLSDERVRDQQQLAAAVLNATDAEMPLARGLSPHAPYSTHPQLLHTALALTIGSRSLVAVHLAETEAELELLQRGTGEFREFLVSLGLCRSELFGGRTVRDWLEILSEHPRPLVIHGNYLTLDDLAVLARNPHMTLVYCPRTHAAFGHRPHPWLDLLALGGSVAVGTDSRASNPDLSLWRELQCLAEIYPDVSPFTLLKLGTQNGARALGRWAQCGSLTVGKRADVAVVRLDDPGFQSPQHDLFAPGNRIAATMIGGVWASSQDHEPEA